MIIEDMLEKLGFITTLTINGLEAIEETSRRSFDLIVMDCRMPKMDGYEATEIIRETEAQKNKKRTLIIALTANALKEDEQKCIQAGMDYYLSKPINEKLLISILEKEFKEEN